MAEEFHQAGANYYWWNNTTPSAVVDMTDPMSLGLPSDMDMKPRQRKTCENSGGLLLDSTLQMFGFGHPSSDSDWTQPSRLLRGGGGDCNYNNSMLQEDDTTCSISYQNHKDWSSPPKSFSSEEDDSSPSSFNNNTQIINTSGFNNIPAAADNSYDNTNYSCPSLLQTLLDHPQQQQDASLFSYSPSPKNSWQKHLSPFLQQEPKQQHVASSLHFSNNINTPFWNATPAAPAITDNIVTTSLLPPQSPFASPNLFATKTKPEQVRDSTSRKGNTTTTTTDQPVFKRPRMETPSSLPTFKVRKEKLGDRITALQQLVSPFGKTDTASVLHEAIEYIKFLHDQVSVLSTPYMKNRAPLQHQQMQASSHDRHHKAMKEREVGGEAKQDLRSRGLCVVPISSTFPVGSESSPDFWSPTFGATFRIGVGYILIAAQVQFEPARSQIKEKEIMDHPSVYSGPYAYIGKNNFSCKRKCTCSY